MTAYPSAVDYTLALQNPGSVFTDASLRTATFTQGLLGPYGIAGSSAVVFHVTVDDGEYALRCYTRQDASTPERYAAFDNFVASNGLSTYVGIVTWQDGEIRVKGASWPVLKMEWIAGQQLNEYAGYLADHGNGAALRTLAGRWLQLVNELQRVSFAHGDLQHGNILVDQQGHLRLVDFDSIWIPPLAGQTAPTETGHPSYQPHGGTAQGRWGRYMDTFSALVIYLALTALAADPGLWQKFNNGDNLLFERDDFAPPYETDIWKHLAGLGDPDVDRMTVKLRDCCALGWVAAKTLSDTLKVTWWERGPASGPTTIAPPAAATGTVRVTPTPTAAAPGPATGPASPASGGHQWHVPSVPSQPATPAGSLPPPPTSPYQSTVASQSAGPSSGPWRAGTTGPAATSGSWWQQGQAPSVPVPKPPAKVDQSTARVVGAVFGLVGLIVFIVLVANSNPVSVVGAVLVIIGFWIWITAGKPKPPPGNPPASGGT